VLRTATRARGGRELLRLIMSLSRSQLHGIGAAQLVVWGATFYAIPPLLPRISAALDVTTTTLTLAITLGLVLNALLSLAVAAWIQRRGARGAMVAGSLVAACALLGLGTSPAAPIAFASLVLLGAAHAALLYEPAFAAISARTQDPAARTRGIQVVTFWGG
jgi:MFS family permease